MERKFTEPDQKFWRFMLWMPLVAVLVWLGARWITPSMNAEAGPPPPELAQQLPAEGFALVEMGATWCPACRVLKPEVSAFAAAQPQITVIEIDIDEEPAVPNHYAVRAIPVMLLFKDGEMIDHFAGVKRQAALNDWLTSHGAKLQASAPSAAAPLSP